MLLYEITRQYKTLSVIGMCKNAGKTTAMNALIRENGKHGGTLGLTSIGRDGESVDVVTKTHKPGIYVLRGTVIATASAMLRLGDTTNRILDTTGISTPLGEVVVVQDGKVTSIRDNCRGLSHMCIFEYIYFARPDSVICGQSVHQARVNAGRLLAREHPVEADLVVGVPDSGLDAARGYALESGIPNGMGFVKNRYVGRTFITPDQQSREQAVRIKLSALASEVAGKRVVMVDDSIVRGTTCRQIINLLREAGATEVHMRVSSPPFISPCYFGTDIPDKEKLIACHNTIEEIRQIAGADSLGYLSLENLHQLAPDAECGFCEGCFTGKYPIDVD